MKLKIEKIFLAIAIPLSICFAIFMLPLNVPDEGVHFSRAYDISEGNIFVKRDENGNSYSIILKELEDDSYTRISSYTDLKEELSKDTNYDEETQRVCAAQSNSPILYIGTTIAILICKILNCNIFYAFYLGRIFNIIIYLIFGYLTIRKIPFGKVAMAVYLCMPMMLQQAASCSGDSILNATLIYYIAHIVYIVFKETPITKKDKAILYIFTALIAMFKYIYILIAGILFITIFRKKEEKRELIKTIGIMILIGSIFAIGWFMYTTTLKSVPISFSNYYQEANINTAGQIQYIKENPIQFIITFAKEYLIYGQEYIFGAVGSKLGWLDINVNMGIITAFIVILIISVISEESKFEFTTKSKTWILTILFTITLLLKIVMYITWSPVGSSRVCGLQGRYYTPILFLVLLCLVKKNNNWKVKNLDTKMMLIAFGLNIFTLLGVIKHFI